MRYLVLSFLFVLLCFKGIAQRNYTAIGLQAGLTTITSSSSKDAYESYVGEGFLVAFAAERHFDKKQRALHISIAGKMGIAQFESTEKYTLIDPYYPDKAIYHSVRATTRMAQIGAGAALNYTILRSKRVQMHTGLTAMPMLELGNFEEDIKMNMAIEAHYGLNLGKYVSLGMRVSQPLDGYRASVDIGPRRIGNKYVLTNVLFDFRYIL
jgi:hypothetical protein